MEIDYNNLIQEYLNKAIRPICLQLRAGRSVSDNMNKLRFALGEEDFYNSIQKKYNLSNIDKDNLLHNYREQKLHISQNINIYEEAIINAYASILEEGIQTLEKVLYERSTFVFYKILLEDSAFLSFICCCYSDKDTEKRLLDKFHVLCSSPFKKLLEVSENRYKQQRSQNIKNKSKIFRLDKILDNYKTFTKGYGYISEALNLIEKGENPYVCADGYEFISSYDDLPLFGEQRYYWLSVSEKSSKSLDLMNEEERIESFLSKQYYEVFVHEHYIEFSMEKTSYNDECLDETSYSKKMHIHFHDGFKENATFLIWAYLQSATENKFDNIKSDLGKYMPFFGIKEIEEGEIEEY